MAHCHILSLNVRGLRNKDKRNQIFRWSKHQKPDILFLQETYWSSDFETIVRSEWHGPCFFAHGTNHSRGVSILFNDKLDVQDIVVQCIFNGQLLMLRAKVHDTDLMLVNVYAATQRQYREGFFCRLNSELIKHYKGNCELILGGDWNCVLNISKDVQGTNNRYYKKPTNLKKIMNIYALCDVWRLMHPGDKQYTWRNTSLKRASRLDFWLVTKEIKRKTSCTDIRPAIRADHNAISITSRLCTKRNKRGPGYWKINTQILNDPVYQNENFKIIDSFQITVYHHKQGGKCLKLKFVNSLRNTVRNKHLRREIISCH